MTEARFKFDQAISALIEYDKNVSEDGNLIPVAEKRDLQLTFIDIFGSFVRVDKSERFQIYGELLDKAFGKSRHPTFRDLNPFDCEEGQVFDRLEERVDKIFGPICRISGYPYTTCICSETDIDGLLHYRLADAYVDEFDVRNAFSMYSPNEPILPLVRRTHVKNILKEKILMTGYNLANRLFAMNWRQEACELSAEIIKAIENLSELDYSHYSERLKKLANGQKKAIVRPNHHRQKANFKLLRRAHER